MQQTKLTPSQRRTLEHLRDARALGMSALNLQQLADLYALREQGLATFSGTAQFGAWRPAGDVWGDAR